VGVWEAVWSQAATETAEGEGRWSREGGAESVVARRQRGVSAVTPVNAGSHSSRCVEDAVLRCRDVESVDEGWLCGGGLCDADQNWRGLPGVQRMGGLGWWAERRVLRCLCGRAVPPRCQLS